MELAGNEKQIQALFCELKLEDERAMPGFQRLWNRAEAKGSERAREDVQRRFKFSFALATTIVVIALSALVVWSLNSRNQPRMNEDRRESAAQRFTRPDFQSTTAMRSVLPAIAGGSPTRVKPRIKANTRESAQKRFPIPDSRFATVIAISNWQSPTATLLWSPSAEVLTSLPQLDQAANDLDTFLNN